MRKGFSVDFVRTGTDVEPASNRVMIPTISRRHSTARHRAADLKDLFWTGGRFRVCRPTEDKKTISLSCHHFTVLVDAKTLRKVVSKLKSSTCALDPIPTSFVKNIFNSCYSSNGYFPYSHGPQETRTNPLL
ncbi:hypothetical protein EXN66_Car000131 [Channa argus]|uniref:Uncharacterized protein n=1 Tax=Channa argus TaxID=215402 RepID=A0A6G1QW93_CHAAH|nr:hypothetical protein EXN66_Car000131 [Channa argus]